MSSEHLVAKVPSAENLKDPLLAEVPIWVGEEQKWIAGFNANTTCHDVIYALMGHIVPANDSLYLDRIAIFENWRGVERQLAGRTKFIKVVEAWGDDRDSVVLTLKKFDGGRQRERPRTKKMSKSSSRGSRTAHDAYSSRCEAHHVQRTVSEKNVMCWNRRQPSRSRSQPNMDEERLLRTGTREKSLNRKKFHGLLKLILDQEKRIKEQLESLKKVDKQIDYKERSVSDLKRHSRSSVVSSNGLFPALKATDIQAYSQACQSLINMEERLCEEKLRVEELSTIIKEETFIEEEKNKPQLMVETLTESKVMDYGNWNLQHNETTENEAVERELMKVKEELNKAIELGLKQQREMAAIQNEMREIDQQTKEKAKLIDDLMCELDEDEYAVNPNSFMQTEGHVSPLSGSCSSDGSPNSSPKTLPAPYPEVQKDEVDDLPNVSVIGKSTDFDDMYTLTIVSDLNDSMSDISVFSEPKAVRAKAAEPTSRHVVSCVPPKLVPCWSSGKQSFPRPPPQLLNSRPMAVF